MVLKSFKSLVFIFTFIGSVSAANAVTICSFSCPSNPADPGAELPQLIEFYSLGNLNLAIENDGLIFLDESLFNSLSGLTINAGTTVYASVNDVPGSIFIPDVLQLSDNTVGFGGDAILTGLAVDYILMADFFASDILNLSSTQGIVLVDAAALTAVPLPAAFWLFVSGMSLLFGVSRKRVFIN